MSKILIIDDEVDLVSLLEKKLKKNGHEVLAAYDGQRGIELAAEMPDLIILDIMMPKADGFEVCRAIREKVFCPILFLSARQSEMDIIKGFTLGGDDYITKPFGVRELMARIEANLRREKRSAYMEGENKRTRLSFGHLALDMQGRTVKIQGTDIPLTKTEYDIVEFLALHAGQVFTKEQIYESVWGYDSTGDNTTVVERVKKIRAKFSAAAPPKEQYICTVWGIGYKWNKI
ncbi:response regulator transcription factor [Luxibacter massiliensis]|uniref:response regulator transcription factor n=1 Tax=Luxibacter massiliensis TaxID=2219695 RepID=UPI000F061AD7|nr:response regulator transcription factor [Luxibacter massiliensis]